MVKHKRNIHGIISILLISTSFAIGIIVMSFYSLLLALLGILTVILFLLLVSALYCSKCKCRDRCLHVLPGIISKMIAKNKVGKYTAFEIVAGVAFPLLIVVVLPQYWLFQHIWFFIVYWFLFVVAGLEISNFVCKKCENKLCPLNKNQD